MSQSQENNWNNSIHFVQYSGIIRMYDICIKYLSQLIILWHIYYFNGLKVRGLCFRFYRAHKAPPP